MISLISNIKSTLSQTLINIPGFRTKRKLVIIESDDWGSIRMPSIEVYDKFIKKGFDIGNSNYNRLDTLENNDDLIMLYEVLRSHSDSLGKPAIMTANLVVGNPDFNKIKESDFQDYFVEPVTETLKKYTNRDKVLNLWRYGYENQLFHPQFHAREHVNVVRWMKALSKKSSEIMFTFDNNTTFSGDGDYNFMEVLDYNTPKDMLLMRESLKHGLDMFEELFGYRSKSFIPPCYTWDSNVEETLSQSGVKYIQGLFIQSVPTGTFNNYTRKYHFLGSRNRFDQRYLMRNCFFEPSLTKSSDPVGACLKRIDLAFKWRKPATIGSHRINFMGDLNPKNRAENLRLLNNLLKRITKQWPEVEFITSDQLGDLIAE